MRGKTVTVIKDIEANPCAIISPINLKLTSFLKLSKEIRVISRKLSIKSLSIKV